jgi:hypothetical protein
MLPKLHWKRVVDKYNGYQAIFASNQNALGTRCTSKALHKCDDCTEYPFLNPAGCPKSKLFCLVLMAVCMLLQSAGNIVHFLCD